MRCFLCNTPLLGFLSLLLLQVFHKTFANELTEQNHLKKNIVSTASALVENGTFSYTKSHLIDGSTLSPDQLDNNLNSTNTLPDWMRTIESGALQRAGYVVLGIMSIILIFFGIRSIRVHHKKSKIRKYGIIVSNASEMEMEPLDHNDDEEEEMTLFDAQHKHLLK